MSVPETVSEGLCVNYLVMQTNGCRGVKVLEAELPGWCDYSWPGGVDAPPCSFKRRRNKRTIHGRQLQWTFPQSLLMQHLWRCAVMKLHISERPFMVGGLRLAGAIITPPNQYLNMPH